MYSEIKPFATIKWPFATCGEWRMGWTTLVRSGLKGFDLIRPCTLVEHEKQLHEEPLLNLIIEHVSIPY
jgi:hypothetical protein